MNRIISIFGLSMLAFIVGCAAPKTITKQEAYPNMFEEKPLSILVIPPVNLTTAADAKDYYLTTVAEPLAFFGYYVYPIEIVTDVLRYEGFPDGEQLIDVPASKFAEYFGCDAVMYISITQWDTSYTVFAGSVVVGIESRIVSAKSDRELWKYSGTIKVDTTGDDGGAGGWAGLITKLVSTAIATATTDYVPIAKRVNYRVLNTAPLGPYHQSYGQDQQWFGGVIED